MITGSSTKGVEILNYLKTVLEIPDNVIELQLNIGVDEIVTIKCTYHANEISC